MVAFGYVEMILFLVAKYLLVHRLSTVVRSGFVCGYATPNRVPIVVQGGIYAV